MMNELQLSLLGLGVLAILLVVIYNRWLERRYRQRHAPAPVPASEAIQEPQGDGVLEALSSSAGDRQEPQWDHADPLPQDAGDEPRLMAGETLSNVPMPEPLPALTEVEAWVDAIATLRFYEPRTAGSIRATVEQMGSTRFERIECYTGDVWHSIDKLPADALVSNIRCRLQLATRRGPVAPDALHEWMRGVESLAQVLSAGLSVETEAKMLERAANLDAFCARVDALINLNLRVRDPEAAVPKMHSQLAALGLAEGYPACARFNAQGDVDFQVLADEAQGLISLTLDFPQVTRPDLAVTDMLEMARTLAMGLDAEIVDDGGRPLGEAGMALLSNQVVRLAAMLQAQGIEPGSPLSRRLFS